MGGLSTVGGGGEEERCGESDGGIEGGACC